MPLRALDNIHFGWKEYNITYKWKEATVNLVDLSCMFYSLSKKLTLLNHHRIYNKDCIDHQIVPKGMFFKLPVTIGSNDLPLINNSKLLDYQRCISQLYVYKNWFSCRISRIRKEFFKLKQFLQRNMTQNLCKQLWDLVKLMDFNLKSELAGRRKQKIQRDMEYNLRFRKNYDIIILKDNQPYFSVALKKGEILQTTEEPVRNNEADILRELVDDNNISLGTPPSSGMPNQVQEIGTSKKMIRKKKKKPLNLTAIGTRVLEGYKPEDSFPVNSSGDMIDPILAEICALGPSFVPCNNNIDWGDVRSGISNWRTNLRRAAFFQIKGRPGNSTLSEIEQKKLEMEKLFVKSNWEPPESFKVPTLDLFLERVENNLLNPKNLRRGRVNLSKDAKDAIENFRKDNSHVLRLQDKGGKFVYSKTEDYIAQMEEKLGDKNKFEILENDPTPEYLNKVKNWCESYKNEFTPKLVKWLVPGGAKPGAVYGCNKTHKIPPSMRTITSGCGTATENLGHFIAKQLKPMASELKNVLKDTTDFLKVVDYINEKYDLPEKTILVSLDVVDMFGSIKNSKGLKCIKEFLGWRLENYPTTKCILNGLKICLESNCSMFNNKFYHQIDGSATGPRYVCDYADLVMEEFDLKLIKFGGKDLISYSRYRDDCLLVWTGEEEGLPKLLDFANSIDKDKNIQFTMNHSLESLEYLDVRVKIENNHLKTSVYSKPTAGHIYLHPDSCHPKNQVESIPYSQALRIKRITSDLDNYKTTENEYANYFKARGYNENLVNVQFEKAKGKDRNQLLLGTKKEKPRKFPLVVQYNPKLPSIKNIILEHVGILHSDSVMAKLFPINSLIPAFRRGKNLKNYLAPSRFSNRDKIENGGEEESGCSVRNHNHCDLCRFLVHTKTIRSFATNEIRNIKTTLTCNSKNIIYCINDLVCKKQNVGSSEEMKKRLSNYKSHLKLQKETCSFVKHFWETPSHKSVNPVPNHPKEFNELLHREFEIILVDQLKTTNEMSQLEKVKNLRKLEGEWQSKLHTYEPFGLNVRGEWKNSVGNLNESMI